MERYRKNVYCEVAFIRDFLSKSEEDSFNFKDNLKIELLHSIKELIFCEHIKLYLDTSLEDFERVYNDIYKKRQKAARKGNEYQMTHYEQIIYDIYLKQSSGELCVACLGSNFPNSDLNIHKIPEFLDAIYLLYKDKNYCQEMMNNYGVIVISPENITDFQNIPLDIGVAIQMGISYTWKNILKNKIPCFNSMVIVDNYIDKNLTENLKSIFEISLPKEIKCPIHISIFTLDKDIPLSQKRLEVIESFISECRPNLEYSCALHLCKKHKFHDRMIITNNLWISCGAGFDLLYDSKPRNETTVNIIHPFINKNIQWTTAAYSNLLSKVKENWLHNISANQENTLFCVGNSENRLISKD